MQQQANQQQQQLAANTVLTPKLKNLKPEQEKTASNQAPNFRTLHTRRDSMNSGSPCHRQKAPCVWELEVFPPVSFCSISFPHIPYGNQISRYRERFCRRRMLIPAQVPRASCLLLYYYQSYAPFIEKGPYAKNGRERPFISAFARHTIVRTYTHEYGALLQKQVRTDRKERKKSDARMRISPSLLLLLRVNDPSQGQSSSLIVKQQLHIRTYVHKILEI